MERRTEIEPARLEVMVENLEGYILEKDFDNDVENFSEFLSNEMGFTDEEKEQTIPLISGLDGYDLNFSSDLSWAPADEEQTKDPDEWEEEEPDGDYQETEEEFEEEE